MAFKVILKIFSVIGALSSHHIGYVENSRNQKQEAMNLLNNKIWQVQGKGREQLDLCSGKFVYDQKEDGTHEFTCDLTKKTGGKRGLKSRKSKKTKKRKTLKNKRKQTKKRKSLKKKRKTRRK